MADLILFLLMGMGLILNGSEFFISWKIHLFLFLIFRDGTFFALKEVSLLDEDSQGRQSIYQLQQVIYTCS